MNERVLERRMLLRGAGVAGATLVGVAAVPAAAQAHDHHGDIGVLGSWLVTHADAPPGDTTPVLGVISFAAGGVATTLDLAPSGPGGAGAGAWASRGSSFAATFYIGAPAEGPKQPAVVIKVVATGMVQGDRISGTYTFTIYDAKTKKRVGSGHGSFSGTRIRA
jgi:hypothetical protein